MRSHVIEIITKHAREIAGLLSESLADLEVRSTAVSIETARLAIHDVWLTVLDDFERGHANFSSVYLANVHERLTSAAGLEDSSGFAENGLPILPDGSRESWSRFVEECRYNEIADDHENTEEEYALSQLRWGGHVQTFAMSLGWLVMNIVRLRRGQHAVFPPPADHERLLSFLAAAGPDTYDAEDLRGLMAEYAVQQIPK